MTTVSVAEFARRASELLESVEAGATVVVQRDDQAVARLEPESARREPASARIVKTPGICGGRACIAGHRIRVMDIVASHEQRGCSPDEIVQMYPGITHADVHAALAYYFDNHREIADEFRKDEECAEWITRSIPSKIPADLKDRMSG